MSITESNTLRQTTNRGERVRPKSASLPAGNRKGPLRGARSRGHKGRAGSTSHQDELSCSDWVNMAWKAIIHGLVRLRDLPHWDSLDPEISGEKEFKELYAKRWEEGTATAWLKYHTSYVFAFAQCQEEVPVPPGPLDASEKPGRPCRKKVGRAISQVMARSASGSWQSRRVAYDILMSKLGCPPARPVSVAKALRVHRDTLCRYRSDHCVKMVRDKTKDKIREIVQAVFGNTCMKHKDPIPSLRACCDIHGSIGKGGAVGALATCFMSEDVKTHSRWGNTSLCFTCRDSREVNRCLAIPDFICYTNQRNAVPLYLVNCDDLVREFQDTVDRWWVDQIDHPIRAEPVALCEPLKVRIITKGEPAEYYRCIELQKFLHRTLSHHPVFEYAAHPIDDKSWALCFGKRGDLLPGQFYVSGDYKGATDNLDPRLSEYAWEQICEVVRGPCGRPLKETLYGRLGLKALTGHSLFYEETGDDANYEHYHSDKTYCNQQWGQLMGSPISFPILCIVNAAASLAALDRPFNKTTQMKVNGDDIAFICNKEEYELWKYYTRDAGLEFSVGKNYVSTEFLLMNSELRRPPSGKTEMREVPYDLITYIAGERHVTPCSHQEADWAPWKLEGFVNQSILFKLVKKGQRAGQPKSVCWPELSSLSEELYRGIDEKFHIRLHTIFRKTYEKEWELLPPGCFPYAPKCIGGAGIVAPVEVILRRWEKMTQGERDCAGRIAAYLLCNVDARAKWRCERSAKIGGSIGRVLSEVKSHVNNQVPKVIAPKPLLRNQKQTMGGSLLLGLLLHGLSLECTHDETDWRSSVTGGVQELEEGSLKKAADEDVKKLNWKYAKLREKANSTSLQPTSFERMMGIKDQPQQTEIRVCEDPIMECQGSSTTFSEVLIDATRPDILQGCDHLELRSLVELIPGPTSQRALDMYRPVDFPVPCRCGEDPCHCGNDTSFKVRIEGQTCWDDTLREREYPSGIRGTTRCAFDDMVAQGNWNLWSSVEVDISR